MLNKQNRLQKTKDFNKVFRVGRPISAGLILVRAQKRPDSGPSRFGFVISNKIERRATRRNALKRRFRSAVRDLELKTGRGFNIVIVIKRNYPYPYQFNQIKADLEEAFVKSNLILR